MLPTVTQAWENQPNSRCTLCWQPLSHMLWGKANHQTTRELGSTTQHTSASDACARRMHAHHTTSVTAAVLSTASVPTCACAEGSCITKLAIPAQVGRMGQHHSCIHRWAQHHPPQQRQPR